MKKLITIITILMILAPSLCLAEEPLILPNDFQYQEVLTHQRLNSYFQAVQEHTNKRLVVMSDYGTPEGIDKTFEQSSSPTTLTSVTDADMGGGNYEQEWAYSDGSKKILKFSDGEGGKYATGRREINALGVTTQDLTYFPAVLSVDVTAPLALHDSWGDAYTAKKPDGSEYGIEMVTYTVMAINQKVTVPAGTFDNCAKIRIESTYDSYAWYAPGVGLIKRFGVDGLLELQSVE